ncbi:MAG: hypothetical protein ABSB40_00230 [Nitrososphaeria archaeon]|jgi:hypothetical protein
MIKSKDLSKAHKTGEEEQDVQIELERELSRLQSLTGLNGNLKVNWIPDGSREVHGEVISDVIHVYDEDLEEAIRTLKHEFVDYCITREVVTPLVDLVNALIKSREAEVYRRKEKLVELFSSLI